MTPSLSSKGTCNASDSSKGLTPTPSAACTAACTSEPENANADAPDAHQGDEGEGTDQGDRLDKLAAALLTLSPADRERLAAMLTGHQGKAKGATE